MSPSTHAAVPDERNAAVEVWINGEFFPRDQAKISVFDSGFLVGDGIWEGMRLHDGHFAFLDRHLDRLFSGLAAARIELGMTRDDVIAALRATVDRNGMTDGAHVRLMVTRGTKKTPSQHPSNLVGGPNVVIIAEYKTAAPEVLQRGLTLFTATIRRPPPDTLDQRLNSHSKLHEVIALIQAVEAGADEALMLDLNGAVATCNATNFFLVHGDEVWTSVGMSNLPGITRAVVLEVARQAGIPAHEKAFSLSDVYGASEAFVTGTFGGLTPVVRVDGRQIGTGMPGPMTARLRQLHAGALEASMATMHRDG